jgi:hypothetical protein
MTTWKRKPQEQEGSYFFAGTFYVTQGVINRLSQEEIMAIYFDIQKLVKEKGGIDYFQVYVNAEGDKLYFIDQLDADMIAGGAFAKEDNHCTLLLSREY